MVKSSAGCVPKNTDACGQQVGSYSLNSQAAGNYDLCRLSVDQQRNTDDPARGTGRG